MTTRIQDVQFVQPDQARLSIDATAAKRLLKKHNDDYSNLPEYCFLHAIEEKLGSQTKEKFKCSCGTQSYGNAKFCRECGTKISKPAAGGIPLDGIDWSDEGGYDCNAANTFFPVFINEVVPHLRGYAECSVTYAEDQDDEEDIRWKTAHFIINNGEVTWCEIQLRPGADAPVFDADDLYNPADHEDEEEDEDDEDDE